MTQAHSSSVGERAAREPVASSAWRPTQPAGRNRRVARDGPPLRVVPAVSERRRAQNRQNLGFVTELRCECAIAHCRETFPAAADHHRGTEDCFIVAPAHLNGDTPLKVADRFFVIARNERR
jgi:hypothetical protein